MSWGINRAQREKIDHLTSVSRQLPAAHQNGRHF